MLKDIVLTPETVKAYADKDSRALMLVENSDLIAELSHRLHWNNGLGESDTANSMINALCEWAKSNEYSKSIGQHLSPLNIAYAKCAI